MSTNYYAHWRPPGASTVVVELHICKSLRSFSGLMFDSWAKWRDWLLHQSEPSRLSAGGSVEIVDEYGDRHDLEQFIAGVEATDPEDRGRQTNWVKAHPYELGTDGGRWDWLDADGFSFHRGEFS